MKKLREFWLNANNWSSIDTQPFHCDDIIHLREVDPREPGALAAAIKVIEATAKVGPDEGTICEGIACAYCDMGGAGYASRGDGFHDDDCACAAAQRWLKRYRP